MSTMSGLPETRSRFKSSKQEHTAAENVQPTGDATPNTAEALATGESESILLQMDKQYTKCLAICASRNSSYGWLRPLMKALENSCHGIPWLLLAAWAILNSRDVKNQTLALNLMLALIFDLIMVGVVKTAAKRPRPQHNEMDMFFTVSVDHFSFPSGHSTRAAMLLYFFLDQLVLPSFVKLGLIMWSVCVSLSRVMLGRHHVSDVISGFIMGLSQYVILHSVLWIEESRAGNIVHGIQQCFGLI
ncbi:phospholipid phosphatase 6 [Lingula anatina]|uniref:Phospholipid phosphatase 6 n=1 Tax=Lingula anatina TaxID=7574 RepID=A0A1S3KD33_LINAN|nr:phospholipid phosphatase 6 [Lingula anatina]|eukprot:XP_013420364.1 phospholipid phosphatase 6 [Lingula anatina]